MAVRSPLRFAEHVLPAPTPIREWSHFWEWLDSQRAPAGGSPTPRPTGHNPQVTARARVDEGRWIADCPWGCGVAFALPRAATWFWCTECAGGGLGLTSVLEWPPKMAQLVVNLSTLPALIQHWPCPPCRNRPSVCESCELMTGGAPRGHHS